MIETLDTRRYDPILLHGAGPQQRHKIVSLYDTFNKNYVVHINLNAHGVDPVP